MFHTIVRRWRDLFAGPEWLRTGSPSGFCSAFSSALSPCRDTDTRNTEDSFLPELRIRSSPGIDWFIPASLFLPFQRTYSVTSPWVSTRSELTRRSVSPSGLVHLRMIGPHQKLGWRRVRTPSGSRPVLPAAIPSRCFLNHPEQWGFPPTILREDLQGGSWTRSGSPSPLLYPEFLLIQLLLSLPLSASTSKQDLPTNHTHIHHHKRESRIWEKC